MKNENVRFVACPKITRFSAVPKVTWIFCIAHSWSLSKLLNPSRIKILSVSLHWCIFYLSMIPRKTVEIHFISKLSDHWTIVNTKQDGITHRVSPRENWLEMQEQRPNNPGLDSQATWHHRNKPITGYPPSGLGPLSWSGFINLCGSDTDLTISSRRILSFLTSLWPGSYLGPDW